MRRLFATLLTIALFGPVHLAAAPADFAGEWRLRISVPDAAPLLGRLDIEIVDGAPILSIS